MNTRRQQVFCSIIKSGVRGDIPRTEEELKSGATVAKETELAPATMAETMVQKPRMHSREV